MTAARDMSPGPFVGGPCPDPTHCRHYGRHAAGPWTCEFNHPRAEIVAELQLAPPVVLTRAAARLLTEEVKADAVALWAKLLALYEGKAHIALGYASWAAYCEEEFGESKSHGYRLFEAARVDRALSDSPIGERPANEAVARELAPLGDDPELLAEAWAEVIKRHGEEPTAAQTRTTVNGHRPERAPAIDPSTTFPDVLAVVVFGREPRILAAIPLAVQADDLADLDLAHAGRYLAQREAELRETAEWVVDMCACDRPMPNGEGGCVRCAKGLRA